jgi:hypothetical protein
MLQSYLCSNLRFAQNIVRTIERIKAYHIYHYYNTSTPIRGLLIVLFLLQIMNGSSPNPERTTLLNSRIRKYEHPYQVKDLNPGWQVLPPQEI